MLKRTIRPLIRTLELKKPHKSMIYKALRF